MARPDLSDLGEPGRPFSVSRPPSPGGKNPPPPDVPPLFPPPPPETVLPAYQGDDPDGGPAASDVLELRRLLIERAKREIEGLKLYEPLPIQAEFHESGARARLIRGSNRSGKTLSAAVEFARAVTGQDPHGKYPAGEGRAYVVGRDEKHLGEVIYRKLFRPGAFRMVRDAETRRWRAYRPWSEADKWRKAESKPAPPLIPGRFIKGRPSWKSKTDNVPEKIRLTTGWEIDFFSSLGKPPRGSDLDLVWFDEEIVDSDWYPEMSARLLDRGGRIIWGATPQTGSDRLWELHLRCEREHEAWVRGGRKPGEQPQAREFLVLLADNPHIDEDQKRELAADLSDEEHAVRIGGGFALEASKIYPEFSRRVHGTPYFDIPQDWTRYAVVDPGRQVCAVLFAAVPPPDGMLLIRETDLGEPVWLPVGETRRVILYDELYIQNASAASFGEAMRKRCEGQDFQAFVIDTHGGRITDIGSGLSVEAQYSAALRLHGIASAETNSGFAWGSDDIPGGVEAVRALLRVDGPTGCPHLLAVDPANRLPNFVWEIERYRYKRVNGLPTDKPEDRGRVHLMATLRYLAMYQPKFVEPAKGRRPAVGAYAAYRARESKRHKKAGPAGVNFGPPR